jgi:hypothetical protein
VSLCGEQVKVGESASGAKSGSGDWRWATGETRHIGRIGLIATTQSGRLLLLLLMGLLDDVLGVLLELLRD